MSNTRCWLNGELYIEYQINSSVSTGNMDEMFLKTKAGCDKRQDLQCNEVFEYYCGLNPNKKIYPFVM